ncbi:MAG: Crp/Fnr family transcriptional regulator [Bacteriovoracaceae bacterium]
MTTAITTTAAPKSGVRVLKAGEILFNENDEAGSLFIIQKGQIRLFKPKGKGFIELAVLRTGEVIGEMAYFDEDGSGKKRSCSASALTQVEIIEISFTAFGKQMQSLNPWFKTIIHTLVARLKKTNSRVKELEDNQASVSYSGKHAGYEFMKPIEIMRILGTLFLVLKAHGEVKGQTVVTNKKVLTLYTSDMYQIMESKLESILSTLVALNWLEITEDADKNPTVLNFKNIELIRQLFIFYNSERSLPDEKKMRISEKCETFINKIIEYHSKNPLVDIPNLKTIDGVKPRFTQYYNLTPILEEFKNRNLIINPEHLDDAKNLGFFGEVITKDKNVFIEADFQKIAKLHPVISFVNAIKKSNAEKSAGPG